MKATRKRLPGWRREALRATLWFVPAVLIVIAVVVFIITFSLDVGAYNHHFQLPFWLNVGNANAGRDILIAIAAAIITTVGVVFSITILALTLASQQMGPRMMRNFVRDRGNQVTLGVFVATFVYSVLALGSISSYPHPNFTPHLCVAVSEVLLLVDVVVLIYFINHIASSIQLPEVIASIARDLEIAIESEYPALEDRRPLTAREEVGRQQSPDDLLTVIQQRGGAVLAAKSGYLQFVGYAKLTKIAQLLDATIRLDFRPGHFIVAGYPIAKVFPQGAAQQVERALGKAHITGPHRTLMQDPLFAIDQLVEIAIRALSPAVNDTFTALTCLDWLSAGLSQISKRELSVNVFRDEEGRIRLIGAGWSYERIVNRAHDKIRQAAVGMPAVLIRLLDNISVVAISTVSSSQRDVLVRQAQMVMKNAEESVRDENDLADVRIRFDRAYASLRPHGDDYGGVTR
ncbi:MAG: uncharacterized protein JWM55_1746 [Acidimicrobiaceae bacterium]|nr:uncharacterized protein [Acidimicrobiaceae bacterium]